MMLVMLLYTLLAGAKDSCYIKALAWADTSKNRLFENGLDVNNFIQAAINNDCSYDLDSLSKIAIQQISKDREEEKLRNKNDTLIDWVTWLKTNRNEYNQEEIEMIRDFAKKGAHSNAFQEYVNNVNEMKRERIDELSRKSFANIAVSIASSDSVELVLVKRQCYGQIKKIMEIVANFHRSIAYTMIHSIQSKLMTNARKSVHYSLMS